MKGPDDTFIIMDVPTQMTRAEQATREVLLSRRQEQGRFEYGSNIYMSCWICFAAFYFILDYFVRRAGLVHCHPRVLFVGVGVVFK